MVVMWCPNTNTLVQLLQQNATYLLHLLKIWESDHNLGKHLIVLSYAPKHTYANKVWINSGLTILHLCIHMILVCLSVEKPSHWAVFVSNSMLSKQNEWINEKILHSPIYIHTVYIHIIYIWGIYEVCIYIYIYMIYMRCVYICTHITNIQLALRQLQWLSVGSLFNTITLVLVITIIIHFFITHLRVKLISECYNIKRARDI